MGRRKEGEETLATEAIPPRLSTSMCVPGVGDVWEVRETREPQWEVRLHQAKSSPGKGVT